MMSRLSDEWNRYRHHSRGWGETGSSDRLIGAIGSRSTGRSVRSLKRLFVQSRTVGNLMRCRGNRGQVRGHPVIGLILFELVGVIDDFEHPILGFVANDLGCCRRLEWLSVELLRRRLGGLGSGHCC